MQKVEIFYFLFFTQPKVLFSKLVRLGLPRWTDWSTFRSRDERKLRVFTISRAVLPASVFAMNIHVHSRIISSIRTSVCVGFFPASTFHILKVPIRRWTAGKKNVLFLVNRRFIRLYNFSLFLFSRSILREKSKSLIKFTLRRLCFCIENVIDFWKNWDFHHFSANFEFPVEKYEKGKKSLLKVIFFVNVKWKNVRT